MNNPIRVEPFDVSSRLQELGGLDALMLLDVLKVGLQARQNCSPLMPVTFPGQAQWAHTIEALRNRLRPMGWTHESHHNLPVTLAPNEAFCVVVYTGDKDTGRKNGYPTNKASKGYKTQQAVLRNNRNLELFPNTLPSSEADAKDVLKTWVLLYHLDTSVPHQPTLRAELSYPSAFANGQIMDWQERIILEEIDLSDNPEIINTGDDELDAPLEIPVRRKAS